MHINCLENANRCYSAVFRSNNPVVLAALEAEDVEWFEEYRPDVLAGLRAGQVWYDTCNYKGEGEGFTQDSSLPVFKSKLDSFELFNA